MTEPTGTEGAASERRVYLAVGLVFAILLTGYLLYQITVVVLVLLVTMLFSIIISAPVDYLERRDWNRGLATLAVLGGTTLGLGIAIVALAPTIGDQAEQLAQTFPALLENAQQFAGRIQSALGLNLTLDLEPQSLLRSARNFLSGGTLTTVASVGAGIASVVSFGAVILIATIYTVAQPRPLVNGLVSLFPARQRQRVREILGEVYATVQRWFIGQLTSMAIIGVLSTGALFIIGIPFALLLGIFSGLISFIPFIGPVISVIPPILLALVNNPVLALWVIAAYVLIQAVESNLIQPLVMSRAVALHPAVVIFALVIMGTLFGFVGVLLAVPLAAALHVLLRELWIERMDELGTDPAPPAAEEPEPTRKKRRPPWPQRALRFLRRS